MSVINSNLTGTTSGNLPSAQELLSRSLNRLSSVASPVDTTDTINAFLGEDTLSTSNGGTQTASAGVQTALSSAQTTDGFLDDVSSLLTRMQQLAKQAHSGSGSADDPGQAQREFSALQDQLRATIGGTTSEIGGTTGVGSPIGSFQGNDLFGPGQDSSSNATNLRQGATLSLINQDGSGNYGLDVSSANAGSTINAAFQQISAGRTAVASTESRLGVAAAKLQIQQQNLLSVFSPITDPSDAQQANQSATGSILSQAGLALQAQGSQTPAAVFNLLQG